MKVLVANRSEIARRIERTCRFLGHEVVGIHVAGDSGSNPPVLDGEVVEVPSYLDQHAIVDAALGAGATAVHPGFGFLAENADFAALVLDAGLTWIGPRPDVIAQMGSKIRAREIAEAAGVPLIPGYVDSQADADLAAAAERIGFPVLVKASAGGGGKGIRIARGVDEFAHALAEARGEAERSFGDTDVMVERYIEQPRHIEVQVVGDKHGNVFHLGTRECSIQRRYQKLFEEAPAPNLPDATRAGLHDAAVQLAAAVDYDSAGTVEFIVDDATGDYFFLEMNTRLQVEHPVTEEITGLDLVELMLVAASGEALPDLSGVAYDGHSIEVRITAEDAGREFMPAVGTVRVLDVPDSVRWESALAVGTEVTPDYDAMIAKLIVHGDDRAAAIDRLRDALDALLLGGVTTTAGFHRWLVEQQPVIDGRVTTRFLDETEVPDSPATADAVPAAAAIVLAEAEKPPWGPKGRRGPRRRRSVWNHTAGFSLTPHASDDIVLLRDAGGEVHEVTGSEAVATDVAATYVPSSRGRNAEVAINHHGYTHAFEVLDRTEAWAAAAGDRAGSGNALVAPFPAAVAEVHVAAGDEVAGGQVLVVIEAMKMLHSLSADGAATVDDVLVAVGDQVGSNQPLVTFTPQQEEDT